MPMSAKLLPSPFPPFPSSSFLSFVCCGCCCCQTELVGRLKPQTPVLGPDQPLNEKDAVVEFVPSDPRAPLLLVPRLECPFR